MENTTEKNENQQKAKKKFNVWMILTFLFLISTIVLGGLLINGAKSAGTVLKPDEVAKMTVNFVNEYFDSTKKTTLNKIEEGKTCFYSLSMNFNGQVVPSYVSVDGKLLFPSEPLDMTKNPNDPTQGSTANLPEMQKKPSTLVEGNFKEITDGEVCLENGKPLVYFFGSEGCPHCVWEKPIISEVASLFGNNISFHKNIDTATDQDVLLQYSEGSIPVLVLGCKYYRLGSGENSGEAAEKENLTKLICKLTNNQPAGVCQ
ncbi:MAG: thioredoxin family protein [Candidatus Paceibacterota bacterium]|jgi:thiol-disulfide isomerase/thioredoxin